MATFGAMVLTTATGELAHRVVLLVRKVAPGKPLLDEETGKSLSAHVRETYDQHLLPLDLEVVDAEDLRARIKKLNKGLPKRR